MVKFGDTMVKCEQLEEAEEFKCVTGAMKDVFGCMAGCVANGGYEEKSGSYLVAEPQGGLSDKNLRI